MSPKSLPEWFRIKPFDKSAYKKTVRIIKENNLNTVCMEANCPNRYKCFSNGTATFMILGNICSRNCAYCNVSTGIPKSVDENEAENLAKAVRELNLDYVVITSVTRDDLEDGGAQHFVNVVEGLRGRSLGCKIELLIPDFQGSISAIRKVVEIKPDVINHNIEVVRSLFSSLRPKGNYDTSIELLREVKKFNPELLTKSGFMLGLGESKAEIFDTMKDLREAGCDILTIGQYLQPSSRHAKVEKYYTPDEFKYFKDKGKEMGFLSVQSGPLVRSSYKAEESYNEARQVAITKDKGR
jgi:lipoic acid synthetase